MNITTGRIDENRKVLVGMDVHPESIALAVAWTDGDAQRGAAPPPKCEAQKIPNSGRRGVLDEDVLRDADP